VSRNAHSLVSVTKLFRNIVLSGAGLVASPVDLWRRSKAVFCRSYHPERHYMRGPGPKWREKHAHHVSILSASSSADCSASWLDAERRCDCALTVRSLGHALKGGA